MKRRFMNFSLLDNFGFNSRCYRTSVVEEGGGGGAETTETTETTEVADETKTAKKFNSAEFRNKKPVVSETTETIDEPKKVTLSDVEYTIDKEGNAVDADNKIVYDKAKVAELQNASAGTYKPLPVWEEVKRQLSEEDSPYELPEELKTGKTKDGKPLNIENEFELLRKVITENTDFTGGDTFMEEYLESKEKGISAEQFLQSKTNEYNLSNLSNTQKAELYFKDYRESKGLKDKDGKWKKGWTDEDISAKVEAMEDIDVDLRADEYDRNVNVRKEHQQKKAVEKYNTDFTVEFNKTEKENTQHITNYLKNIEGKTTIAGIEFSEAEMTQYKKDLPTFIKREIKTDETTGRKYAISPAEELLSNILAKPEDTFELLPYLFMVKNKTLKGYSTRLKEKVKQNLDETLDDTPSSHGGSAGAGSGFDSRKFRTPPKEQVKK